MSHASRLQGEDIHALPLNRTELDAGLEFHHVEDGQGPPLVLLHGVLGDWRSWAGLWPHFRARFRTIAYSRRYNWPNRNKHPSPDHSALVEAQDLAQLLPRWGATPAVLVGSSYGAYTALALAVRRPDLVRALVLLEPPMLSWCQFSERGQRARADFEGGIRLPGLAAFRRGDDEAAVRLLTGGIVGAAALEQMPAELMLRRIQNTPSIRMLTLSSDEFPLLAPDAVAGLRMPTLLMAGERTPDIHASVFEALAAAMPSAEKAVLPDAGHAAERDNPQAYITAVMDFLARHRLTAQP